MAIPNPALDIMSMEPFIIDGIFMFHLITSNTFFIIDYWMIIVYIIKDFFFQTFRKRHLKAIKEIDEIPKKYERPNKTQNTCIGIRVSYEIPPNHGENKLYHDTGTRHFFPSVWISFTVAVHLILQYRIFDTFIFNICRHNYIYKMCFF